MTLSHHRIRVVALAVIQRPRTRELLVFEGHDPTRGLTYHRPLGGEIEFGETAFAAVTRELREEIGAAVEPKRLAGTCESIFVEDGQRKHEIVLLIACGFADASLYEKSLFEDLEGRGEHGIWRDARLPVVLFPVGLAELVWPVAG